MCKVKDFEGNTYHFSVINDEYPEDPREWENLGHMLCFHGRYSLGDSCEWKCPSEMYSDILGELNVLDTHQENEDAMREKGYIIVPLYLYDHGGLSMSTHDFADPWDSGKVGIIYCTEDDINRMGCSREAAEEIMENEVKLYDMYLKGYCYGYEVFDDEGEVIDSCYGYYSDKFGVDLEAEIADEAGYYLVEED